MKFKFLEIFRTGYPCDGNIGREMIYSNQKTYFITTDEQFFTDIHEEVEKLWLDIMNKYLNFFFILLYGNLCR